ncbi:MAG: ABC-2 transporter permease [Butyrivibrio sp.]|nr:ABC-2 transporter permease [Butyrivibrio sp.]
MLGLMEKDLRLTLCRKQTLVIFFVMALLMGISMDGAFIVGYLTMLATIMSVGTISYDEFDNGYVFLMTLPFDRKTYIREKYLFSLIMSAAAWCVGAVLYCTGNLLRHNAINLMDELPMVLAILPVLYLSAAIMIPLQFKYGAEKSRIVFSILLGAIAVLLIGAKKYFNGSEHIIASLAKTLNEMSSVVMLIILTALCSILALTSYLISIQIMKKKEF